MFESCKKTNMEIEIAEQAKIFPQILESYLDNEDNININLPQNINRIVVVASGSSYHCARFAVDLFEKYSKIETRAIYSSEFIIKNVIPEEKDTLYIFITQSGETSDTLKAVDMVKAKGLSALCITNASGSTIWNKCDYQMACFAGVENGIAATKSFSAQMLDIVLIVLKILENRNGKDFIKGYVNSLKKLSSIVEKAFEQRNNIKKLAKHIASQNVIIASGDGISYSVAKEATLKIKETSYKNVTAAILGEFMHGHVAVLNNKKSTLMYFCASKMSERAVHNLGCIKTDYNPKIAIIGVCDERVKPDYHIEIECEDELQYLFANVIISQIMALETALKLHRNVDNPKGLHKVVVDKTV